MSSAVQNTNFPFYVTEIRKKIINFPYNIKLTGKSFLKYGVFLQCLHSPGWIDFELLFQIVMAFKKSWRIKIQTRAQRAYHKKD